MTKDELERLKKMVDDEISRRNRINELLKDEKVKELLEITNTKIESKNTDDYREILSLMLENFKITHTNNIYICTDAYYLYDVGYNHPEYEASGTAIDSEYSEYKTYKNIESLKKVHAVRNKRAEGLDPSIADFEKKHIILNPYNENSRRHPENGLEEIRLEFFENCFTYGQPMSLKLLKMKYPKL